MNYLKLAPCENNQPYDNSRSVVTLNQKVL